MAYTRYGQHDKSFICDEVEDLATLPYASMGSTCYVIANASKYMVNSRGEWIRQTFGNETGPGNGEEIDLSKYATKDEVVQIVHIAIETIEEEQTAWSVIPDVDGDGI